MSYALHGDIEAAPFTLKFGIRTKWFRDYKHLYTAQDLQKAVDRLRYLTCVEFYVPHNDLESHIVVAESVPEPGIFVVFVRRLQRIWVHDRRIFYRFSSQGLHESGARL